MSRRVKKTLLRLLPFAIAGVVGGLAMGALAATEGKPASGPILSLEGTTANVAGAPDSIRIELFRWSTDTERDRLVSAWSMKKAAPARSGAAGRGAAPGRAGRGGAAGGGGRGGRGGNPFVDAPATPEAALAAALQQAPTVGYLWSSEVAGYALRFAARAAEPDGSERIVLITDRRLGAANDLWKPAGGAAPSAYDFSVIELRLNANGQGEGKISLTGKVAPDDAVKVVALENYDALPVVMKNLKRRPGAGRE